MAIKKSTGLTRSESYLAALCEKTFLRLWSYPNPFRDQGGGKELCDLVVVFGRDLLLFSDKQCVFDQTCDLHTGWSRWFRKAIYASAQQLVGAERWIRKCPHRIFLGQACTTPFPLKIDPQTVRVHRIVVAHGAMKACRDSIGGSGSLVLSGMVTGEEHWTPSATGYAPFHIGDILPGQGVIHVLDDVTLSILLQELDTISDFVAYLRKKEQLLRSGQFAFAEGEEDLLAIYLEEFGPDGDHGFPKVPHGQKLAVVDGAWQKLQTHAQFIQKKRADRESYLWDRLIDDSSTHAMNGTLREGPDHPLEPTEELLRFLARENRFDRRVVSHEWAKRARIAPADKVLISSMASRRFPDTAYVFVFMPASDSPRYRERRQAYLSDYCLVYAWKYRQYRRVIGIATEAPFERVGESHDLCLVSPDEWTPEMESEARTIQQGRGFLYDHKLTRRAFHHQEFPDVRGTPGRNEACPCGSGLKFKRCHGRQMR